MPAPAISTRASRALDRRAAAVPPRGRRRRSRPARSPPPRRGASAATGTARRGRGRPVYWKANAPSSSAPLPSASHNGALRAAWASPSATGREEASSKDRLCVIPSDIAGRARGGKCRSPRQGAARPESGGAKRGKTGIDTPPSHGGLPSAAGGGPAAAPPIYCRGPECGMERHLAVRDRPVERQRQETPPGGNPLMHQAGRGCGSFEASVSRPGSPTSTQPRRVRAPSAGRGPSRINTWPMPCPLDAPAAPRPGRGRTSRWCRRTSRPARMATCPTTRSPSCATSDRRAHRRREGHG